MKQIHTVYLNQPFIYSMTSKYFQKQETKKEDKMTKFENGATIKLIHLTLLKSVPWVLNNIFTFKKGEQLMKTEFVDKTT